MLISDPHSQVSFLNQVVFLSVLITFTLLFPTVALGSRQILYYPLFADEEMARDGIK